jgi:hypothetical protein
MLATGATTIPFALGVGATIYGFFRTAGFFPGMGEASSYYKALLATPYDGTQPLPAGPMFPVAQDLLTIGVMALVAAWVSKPAAAAWVLTAYFLSFSTFAAAALWDCGRKRHAYFVVLCVLLSFNFNRMPVVLIALAGTTFAVAGVFLRQTLLEFPWDFADADPRDGLDAFFMLYAGKRRNVSSAIEDSAGWPFWKLAPRPLPADISVGSAVALGMLMALAVAAFFRISSGDSPQGRYANVSDIAPIAFSWFWVLLTTTVRFRVYTSGYRSPITLFGRLASGRLLVPSYDQVWLTPLAALVIHAVLTSAPLAAIVPLNWLIPIAVGVNAVIALAGPPSLSTWRTTGGYRMSPPNKWINFFMQN